jgi:hypothetical protein
MPSSRSRSKMETPDSTPSEEGSMGLFKQMKQMKEVVAEAPELIAQAQALGSQAQQLQAAQMAPAGTLANAQQMAAAGALPGTTAGVVDAAALEPIAGRSLEVFAQLSKAIAVRGLDKAGADAFVQTQGISASDYQAMCDGWAERFRGNTALAVHFGNLYQAAPSL